MNSACIIAACAAASRANQNNNSYSYVTGGKGFEVYYKVKLRKYYHFKDMILLSFVDDFYTGSIYAPVLTHYYKPVRVPMKTVAIEHVFTVPSSKCTNGIDNYIKENLDAISKSDIFAYYDDKVINEYRSDLNKELKIDVDPSSFSYTSQFCWEVC